MSTLQLPAVRTKPSLYQRFMEWLWPLPESFDTLIMRRRRKAPLNRLYVLHVNFEVDKAMSEKMEQAIAPLREKYGIDFIVMEPGMQISTIEDL